MARRRFVIAYDIADPVRLRKVAVIMERYGERLQYSVFLCDLSGMEVIRWRAHITSVVNLSADSIVVIDLGPLDATAAMQVLGVPRRFPSSGPTII